MNNAKLVKTGGICLVVFALVWIFLLILFDFIYNFPGALLNANSKEILPAMLANVPSLRTGLTIHAILPILLIPGVVASYYALREVGEAGMRMAMTFGIIGAAALMIGAMVWPALNWHLAIYLKVLHADHHEPIIAMTHALNFYLVNYIGEYLGYISLSIWILFCSHAMLKLPRYSNWYGVFGVVIGGLLLLGVLLKMTTLSGWLLSGVNVVPILAAWAFILGIGMLTRE